MSSHPASLTYPAYFPVADRRHVSAPVPAARRREAEPASGTSIAKARRLGPVVAILAGVTALLGPAAWLVGRFALSSASVETVRIAQWVALGAEGVLGLATLVVLLVWVHGAHVALHRAGARTTLSPGMAVGGWFIPFANLVLPFVAVRDAVRIGKNAAGVVVVVWWPLWLGYAVLHVARRLAITVFEAPEVSTLVPLRTLEHLTAFLSWSWIPDLAAGVVVYALLAVVVGLASARR